MRRRREDSVLSFDSLLDILSNVVGLMVLLAVVTVLNSRDITISLGSPILQNPPEGAERILFECHDNRVAYVDDQTIDKNIVRSITAYNKEHGKRPAKDELPKLFQRTDVGSKNYRVKAEVDQGAVTFIYQLRRPELGDTIADLHGAESEFHRIIGSLDPKKHFVFFIVRNDSFEAFRAARRMARARQLTTGWHPHPKEEPLRFRPSGTVGSQVQ